MSKINRHPVRRTAAGVLAGALTLTGVVAVATPAAAAPTFGLERIAGEGRYETSAAIARAFVAANTGAVTNVILASGENTNTPDALAASFLAGVQNAPVVLTQRSTTPGATRDVLATLRTQGATTLTVVGGPAAVAEEQITALRALGWTVNRIGGANRYETAANIATAGEGSTASNVGLLASGVSTIDALAGGPVAFKGRHPMFLTTRDGIPGATVRSMQANGVTSVYILGGEAVVGPRVVAQLAAANISVAGRLAGADRSATSVAIANAVIGGTFGFSATTFNVASGINNGVDALGGAALSGKQNRVLLITNNAGSAAPITAFAAGRVAQLTTVGNIFGGTTVVSAALETAIETAAGATQQATAYTVTPASDTTVTTSQTVTYTVSGLTAGELIRVELVAPTAIAAGGVFTLDATNRNAVLTAAANATVNQINGVDVTGAQAVNFTANGSTVTFRVAGSAATSAVPVVYRRSAAGDTTLNVNLAGRATEAVGIGGRAVFTAPAVAVPTENVNATLTNEDVVTVNGTTSFTVTNAAGSLVLRDTDVYRLGAATITRAQFQSILSVGDDVTVTYVQNATAATPSTFVINTDVFPDATAAAAALTAPTAVGNVVTVNFTHPTSTTVNGTAYTLQRAQVVSGVTGAFTTVRSGNVENYSQQTLTETVPDGTYVYRLVYTAPAFSGTATATAASSATVTVPVTAAAAAPALLRTFTTSNTTAVNNLNAGDVIKLVFDRPITAPIQNSSITIGGQTFTFKAADTTADGASTFSVNTAAETIDGASIAAGRVLTVTVLENPAGAVALPATITAFAGIANVTGAATVTANSGVVDR